MSPDNHLPTTSRSRLRPVAALLWRVRLAWLKAMDRVEAQCAIATLHSFRFFGLIFVIAGTFSNSREPTLPRGSFPGGFRTPALDVCGRVRDGSASVTLHIEPFTSADARCPSRLPRSSRSAL
jgi:hypothetical protein